MANEITTIRGNDNFAMAAEAAQGSQIVGERLRFSKGRYLIGRGDFNALAENTELQALDIQAAWVKFSPEGKVVDQRVGFPMAGRDELGDTDEDEWPLKYGEPADPWSNQRYLYLIDLESGAEYTFITSSWGGRAAVEALARQVHVKRSQMPGAIATVRLTVGYRRSQQYGDVPAPKFDVVGWSGGTGEAARPGAVELDDEIPF
jgi:hypothetical protein